MNRLLPVIGLGMLLLSGCSHNDTVPPPTAPPAPPASVSNLPPKAQAAVMSAVPPNELKNLPAKPAQ